MLSLASCPTCILMDDELNILPTSSHVARIAPLPLADDGTPAVPSASAASAAELRELVASLADTQVRLPALWVLSWQQYKMCAFERDYLRLLLTKQRAAPLLLHGMLSAVGAVYILTCRVSTL